MSLLRIRLLFIFLCVASFINAQKNINEYIPENLDSIKTYLYRINSNHIRKINGEFSSKIKKIYKGGDKKVIKSINDSSYVFNLKIEKNLDIILDNIYKANPDIDTNDFNFFIKNSLLPNASCYGDGMFEINLGLFTILDSDDELAFVICHEIAHKLLAHSLKNVTNVIESFNSKETKKKVRNIKKRKYGQARAALSVIEELNIDILDYSKEVEAEADSLGYILFSKTEYLKHLATSSLKKLDREDEMILHHEVNLDSVFDFSNYPFKVYWLKEQISLFDTSEEINEFKLVSDTIKTHPEIEFRVNKLNKDFNIERNIIEGSNSNLNEIKNIAHLQSVKYAIDLKFLDLAIYQLIQKYHYNYISSDYYYSTMAQVLKRIYLAKKNHELGKFVPHKNNFSKEKQLNTIRLFLHNLELGEIKKIGLAFCEFNQSKLSHKQEFDKVHEFFKNINN